MVTEVLHHNPNLQIIHDDLSRSNRRRDDFEDSFSEASRRIMKRARGKMAEFGLIAGLSSVHLFSAICHEEGTVASMVLRRLRVDPEHAGKLADSLLGSLKKGQPVDTYDVGAILFQSDNLRAQNGTTGMYIGSHNLLLGLLAEKTLTRGLLDTLGVADIHRPTSETLYVVNTLREGRSVHF